MSALLELALALAGIVTIGGAFGLGFGGAVYLVGRAIDWMEQR